MTDKPYADEASSSPASAGRHRTLLGSRTEVVLQERVHLGGFLHLHHVSSSFDDDHCCTRGSELRVAGRNHLISAAPDHEHRHPSGVELTGRFGGLPAIREAPCE